MKNPSGSAIERVWHCPASHALPQGRETTAAAEQGTKNHDKIERGLSVGDLSVLPEPARELFRGVTAVDVEVAFALDVEHETVRMIGRRIGRAYGELAPTEIALTVDAIVDTPAGVVVVDWKSRKRVTKAEKNLQVRAGCIAVLTLRKLGEIGGALVYLDDGEIDAAGFDVFAAAAFWADMRTMLRRVKAAGDLLAAGVVPEVHAGSWCEYCPAISHCPSHTRLAKAMLGELSDVETQIAELSAEACGRAWETLKRIQALAERVEDSIKKRAASEPIPLPSGKRLTLVECKGRKSLDQDAVKARFAELGEELPMKRGKDFVQMKEVTSG